MIDAITDDAGAERIGATEVAQPVIVAVELALLSLLASFGVRPAAVAGHSVGEIAATVAAGLLTADDAMRLAVARGQAMAPTAGGGRMLATGLDPAAADALVARTPGVSLAAVNGPQACVVAGDADALEAIRVELVAAGTFARWLPVDYAFHSAQMDTAAGALAAWPAAPAPDGDAVPFFSTVSGARWDGPLDGAYWSANAREPVLLAAATEAMLAAGCDVIVEVGPAPALRNPLKTLVAAHGDDVAVLHCLSPHRDDVESILDLLGGLYVAGCDVRWDRLYPRGGSVAALPPYPWDHQRHWIEPADSYGPAPAHPLLGDRLDLAGVSDRRVWHGTISQRDLPWLDDHRVGGAVLLPAAAFVEMAVAAAARADEPVALPRRRVPPAAGGYGGAAARADRRDRRARRRSHRGLQPAARRVRVDVAHDVRGGARRRHRGAVRHRHWRSL